MDDPQTKLRRDIYVAVFSTAMKLTRSRPQAEDLAQKVFERLLTTRPLEPTASLEDAVKHAFGVLRSVLSAERASARSQGTRERIAGNEWTTASTDGHSAEARTLEHANRIDEEECASRRIALLRHRLADHPLELTILDVMHDGVTKPAEIAVKLARPVVDIYEAMKRIRRYMKSVVAAEQGDAEEVES